MAAQMATQMPVDRLAALRREVEARSARDAGELGFLPRALVQTNLPYRRVPGRTFTRRAGHQRLHVQAPPGVGLPYGRYPRLLLAWIATEAVRTRDPVLDCGATLSPFLRQLGLTAAGGRQGPIHRFREQLHRLLAATIVVTWEESYPVQVDGYRVAHRSCLWWHPTAPSPESDRPGTLSLSLDFFHELLAGPVPVDLRVVRGLVAPLALDIYCWLSYRLHSIRRPLRLPWGRLRQQFGVQYSRTRDFRRAFVGALAKVLTVFPQIRVQARTDGLTLLPLRASEVGLLGP